MVQFLYFKDGELHINTLSSETSKSDNLITAQAAHMFILRKIFSD